MTLYTIYWCAYICTYLLNNTVALCYVYLDNGCNRMTTGTNSLQIVLMQGTFYTCSENTEVTAYCETSDRKRN